MRRFLLTVFLSLVFQASLAHATPTTLNFSFFPTSSAGDTDLGKTHAFSASGVVINAAGFYGSGASDLYYKNDSTSPSEQGLGLNSDPTGDHEIPHYAWPNYGFVQLDLSNVWALSPTAFSMTFSSVDGTEEWAVYGTNTAGSSGALPTGATQLKSGYANTDGTAVTFTTIPTGYKYLDVIEVTSPNANNVLVSSITATVTPEPASMALFGTGLLAIGFVMRKKRFT